MYNYSDISSKLKFVDVEGIIVHDYSIAWYEILNRGILYWNTPVNALKKQQQLIV